MEKQSASCFADNQDSVTITMSGLRVAHSKRRSSIFPGVAIDLAFNKRIFGHMDSLVVVCQSEENKWRSGCSWSISSPSLRRRPFFNWKKLLGHSWRNSFNFCLSLKSSFRSRGVLSGLTKMLWKMPSFSFLHSFKRDVFVLKLSTVTLTGFGCVWLGLPTRIALTTLTLGTALRRRRVTLSLSFVLPWIH